MNNGNTRKNRQPGYLNCPKCGSDEVRIAEWGNPEGEYGWDYYCLDCGKTWGGFDSGPVMVRSGNRG